MVSFDETRSYIADVHSCKGGLGVKSFHKYVNVRKDSLQVVGVIAVPKSNEFDAGRSARRFYSY